ncbi:MAG: hypothetical protein K6G07_05205 [Lachnospiraceae bacterium]|nr:hypothetical protein [Lachnospiraceae bacterium]
MNFGILIFLFVFIYIVVALVSYFTKGHIQSYEVRSGSLSLDNSYSGIVLRDEIVVSANSGGYINYFAREGEHVANGDLVYSLDQSGNFSDLLNDDASEVLLSGNDLGELRTDFVQFQNSYTDASFSKVYDFSYEVEGTILKLSNYNMLNSLKSSSISSAVTFYNSAQSGIVLYNIDGFENKTPGDITLDMLEKNNYKKEQFVNNTLIGANDPVYKQVDSEKWSMVIAVHKDQIEFLREKDNNYVCVKFLKNQNTSWAGVHLLGTEDDYTFVELDFNNSMITFAKDRFLDVELALSDETGLKIPNSAIVEKEFYLIPKDYMIISGTEGNIVLRQSYDEQGNAYAESVKVGIISENEEDYFVNTDALRPGDMLIMQDSSETYPVSRIGSLVGVYNINKGFADFKQITILEQNDEYSIVRSNTQYGLTEYDHIALDATTIGEDDLIYE